MKPQPADIDGSLPVAPKPKLKHQPLSTEDEEIANLVEKPNLNFGGGRFAAGFRVSEYIDD